MSLTATLFLILYLAGICAAIFNPVAGVALYIFVYHLNPETQWWGAAVQGLGTRMSFTIALATAVGMLVRQPRLQHGARQFPLPYCLALLLGLIALGSLTWGVDLTERGQYQAEKFVKILIFLFILIRCVRTPAHYHAAVYSWLVGVLYLGYEAHGGVGVFEQGRLSAGLGGPDFAESSDMAVHLVATLPLIGAVFFMARSWLGRIFALLTGALAVNMLIMTRTRNALVGLALVAYSCVLTLPRGYRLKGLAAVVAGTLLACHLADPGWWNRMATIADFQQDNAAVGRLTYWNAAIQMASDHPFGIGLGNFHHVVMDYVPGLTILRGAHSTVMACLAELGWPGLLVFLAAIAAVLYQLGRVRRTARDLPAHAELHYYRWQTRFHLGWHATALRAALFGYLGCALFTTRLFSEDFWLLMGFGMCLHNVSKYMAAEQQRETAAPPETSPAAPAETPFPPPRPRRRRVRPAATGD